MKSHPLFLWGKGESNSNFYIGFLGYEIRRDGRMRLRKNNINRFDEKFSRLCFALYRYQKSHSEEEFLAHRKKVLDNVLKDVAFYSAFDMGQFKNSAQYRHLEKKRKKLEK